MKLNTTQYKSVQLNADYVEGMAKEGATRGLTTIEPEESGYVLVQERLVPFTFIELVKAELLYSFFEYGCVLSESILFDDAFLQSLTDDERAVLMPCVLMLIERGEFGVNVFETSEEEVEED